MVNNMNKLRTYLNGDRFFQTVITVLMFLFLLIELYPLIYVVSASLSDADAVAAGKLVLWPIGFTLQGYEYVFQNRDIWVGYGNTILYTVLGTLVNLAVTLPCAYALSCKEIVGKGKLMVYFMITMYVSGGLIPGYLNVKYFGLLNTRTFMIIEGALSVYNMIVARTFYENSIPYEIKEAARIDGCNDFGIFANIVVPLSKAPTVCSEKAHSIEEGKHFFVHERCVVCGKCVDVCLGDALKQYGKSVTAEELLPVLLEDRDFYVSSGGDCLVQAEFCEELLRLLKENRVHTAVDTCGFVAREAIDRVMPYTDVFLYDVKAIDEDVHICCTGQSNRIILQNLKYIDEEGGKIEIRIPYVPGYNDTQIEKIAAFLADLKNITKVRVLPYHNYAVSKYGV